MGACLHHSSFSFTSCIRDMSHSVPFEPVNEKYEVVVVTLLSGSTCKAKRKLDYQAIADKVRVILSYSQVSLPVYIRGRRKLWFLLATVREYHAGSGTSARPCLQKIYHTWQSGYVLTEESCPQSVQLAITYPAMKSVSPVKTALSLLVWSTM